MVLVVLVGGAGVSSGSGGLVCCETVALGPLRSKPWGDDWSLGRGVPGSSTGCCGSRASGVELRMKSGFLSPSASCKAAEQDDHLL